MSTAEEPAGTGVAETSDITVGDGRTSTTGPRRGYVYICRERDPNAPGSDSSPWISNGTFSLDDKPVVEGEVLWPAAEYSITVAGDERRIKGNGLPVDYPTGEFPVTESDPVYEFDRNSNTIQEQMVDYTIPATPTMDDEPACIGGQSEGGEVGYLNNGVALLDALDARGDDAVANEVQDLCQGHPQVDGRYHYHWISTCLTEDDPTDERSPVVGWALDGYPITGPRGENGRILTNEDLDECHGTTSTIEIDGEEVETYHYVGNYEFPYTVGCFRGSVIASGEGA